MGHMSAEDIEGRLIAQRKVLARILARVCEPDGRTLLNAFEADGVFQDHQEDPGAVPDSAFAIEAGMADEMRLIVEAARRHSGSDGD